jgi:magnesium transporter
MAKLTRRRPRKTGLPPGSLIPAEASGTTDAPRITLSTYDAEHLDERAPSEVAQLPTAATAVSVTWIDFWGIPAPGHLEQLGSRFGLHPLLLEDLLNTEQRPKIEDYGEILYVVLRAFHFDEGLEDLASEQLSIVIAADFLLSFQERTPDVFEPVRARLRSGKGHLRGSGTDYLAYGLLDTVVDHYFEVLEVLGERIEAIQDDLLIDPRPELVARLLRLKTDLIAFRKAVWPLREVLGALVRDDLSIIRAPTRTYLRDVLDHTISVIDTVETYRDLLAGMLDIYLSSVSMRTNEVMKVLTIIATIFMPLTFIAGVYGMNFRYMPELGKVWAYPAVLLVMVVIAVVMLIYFKKKRWL